MRMSCNGCRVLRKGCSENCSIRPCLSWIKTPEAQANATVFLAKFYGRAGLMNLINGGPEHLRPAIFRSLLHEACGRIVNPIYGSVGLLWSGSWQLCQAAVEAVLKGESITPIASDAAADGHGPPLNAYSIRHVSKDENSAASNDRKRPKTRRTRRATAKQEDTVEKAALICSAGGAGSGDEQNRSLSHESSLSQESEVAVQDGHSKETESLISSETTEAPLPPLFPAAQDRGEIELELSLGIKPVSSRAYHVIPVKKRRLEASGTCEEKSTCTKMELEL